MINDNKIEKEIFYSKDHLSEPFEVYMENLKMVISKAEELKNLIDNYNNFSDEEFFEKINRLGLNSILRSSDYCNILSIANKKNYEGPINISTEFFVEIWEDYGSGKDRERVREKYDVNLQIIYADTDIDLVHIYTLSELNKLIQSKQIVILQSIRDDNLYYGEKKYPKLKQAYDDNYSKFLKKNGEYHKATIKYVRKENSVEKLMEIYDELIETIKGRMQIMEDMEKEYHNDSFQKRIGALNNK